MLTLGCLSAGHINVLSLSFCLALHLEDTFLYFPSLLPLKLTLLSHLSHSTPSSAHMHVRTHAHHIHRTFSFQLASCNRGKWKPVTVKCISPRTMCEGLFCKASQGNWGLTPLLLTRTVERKELPQLNWSNTTQVDHRVSYGGIFTKGSQNRDLVCGIYYWAILYDQKEQVFQERLAGLAYQMALHILPALGCHTSLYTSLFRLLAPNNFWCLVSTIDHLSKITLRKSLKGTTQAPSAVHVYVYIQKYTIIMCILFNETTFYADILILLIVLLTTVTSLVQ